MPDLSVVVVTLKDREDILCLPKFEESEFTDYELILRDDEGISTARNAGIRQARSDKIVFIDDDAVPTEGYLQAASAALESEHVVGGRVTHPGDGLISKLASPYYLTGNEAGYVSLVVGCNMAFRREVFENVGYFDENFGWGHEETELAERVTEEYQIYYEPEMQVIHSYAEDLIDYWQTRYRFGPADVYRSRKRGLSTAELILETFHPKWYYHPVPTALPVAAVGGIIENISRIRALYGQQSSTND